MQCYFLRNGQLAGVEILPLGLSDEDAIIRAHGRSAKRKGPFTALEVWDGSRLAFRERLSAQTRGIGHLRPATRPPLPPAE
jgi:hypothetical protein